MLTINYNLIKHVNVLLRVLLILKNISNSFAYAYYVVLDYQSKTPVL